MTCSPSDLRIFCDWLDVTYSPDCSPFPSVNRMLLDAGFDAESADRDSFTYRHGRAFVVFGRSRGSMRASFSGAACSLFRDLGLWSELLSELSSVPHRVTRVDAALDLPMDGADLVDLMRRRYPSGTANLSRKASPTSSMLAVRPSDGRETGTWYVGNHKRGRYTARVYDKAWEALQKRGELLPPTARVEVTAKGGDSGATLRDAAEPAALFWHLASPAILDAPEGAPVWTANRDLGWEAPKRDFNAAALLQRRVDAMAALDALAAVADELGPEGRSYLLGLIEARLASSKGLQTLAVANPLPVSA
jgi:hypothetical protein